MSTPVPAAHRGARVADIIVTVVLSAVLVVGSLSAAYTSIFGFAMATDSCFERCREEYVGDAFVASWGSVVVALLVTPIAVVVSAIKRKPMFVWPLLGIGIVVAGFAAAFHYVDLAQGN